MERVVYTLKTLEPLCSQTVCLFLPPPILVIGLCSSLVRNSISSATASHTPAYRIVLTMVTGAYVAVGWIVLSLCLVSCPPSCSLAPHPLTKATGSRTHWRYHKYNACLWQHPLVLCLLH
jgi:hypothetical protein